MKNMKNVKKRVIASLALAGAVLSTAVSADRAQGQSKEIPEEFFTMSVQQRIEWIDENIPATDHEGIRINNGQRGNLETYYGVGHNEARMGNEGDLLGEMDTAVEWSVDSSNPTVIQSYDQVDFTVKNYMSNHPPKGTTNSYAVNPGNIKYVFEADIVGPFMGYYLAHDYNLYANGTYSFRPIAGQL